MKYSDKNKPMVCMMTQSTCYNQTKPMEIKGVLWHSTGANNPWLKRYVQPDDNAKDRDSLINLLGRNTYGNDWNHASVQAGLNGWIGQLADGTVATVQTMPWNYRPWGCGSGSKGSCNTGWIQFEICEDGLNDADYFNKVYKEACELTAYLCKLYGIDPKGTVKYNGVTVPTILCHADSHKLGLGSNHGDVLHWFPKFDKNMDSVRNDVAALLKGESSEPDNKAVTTGLQASDLKGLSEADTIKRVGALFTADQKKSGILASVSLAQFILESGYGKSELALNANNCFGLKKSLSGNTWSGSTWDGKSIYTKKTQEQNSDGGYETITADFRKYPCIEDSIADHSAYLLGAMNGNKLRYDGLKGCTDYKKAVQIIKAGGYATSLTYVEKLCSIIEKWKLTDYDVKDSGGSGTVVKWYRVRKSWGDAKSQIGAFKILDNAKKKADENPGYKVYDADGVIVYAPKSGSMSDVPYLVKVSVMDLNIRSGPGISYTRTGKYTGIGVFTIVEEKNDWGKLKSGAGWISLSYAKRI